MTVDDKKIAYSDDCLRLRLITLCMWECLIEQMAHIPVDVDFASEFRYRNPMLSENTL